MNSTKKQNKRKNGRNQGVVFTKKNIVDYLLNEVNFNSNEDLRLTKILEPAAGTGAFAIEIVKRLYESSCKFGFSFIKALENNVKFIEVEINSYEVLIYRLSVLLRSLNIKTDITFSKFVINSDYLTLDTKEKFDCIVGNPPYVRNEQISLDLKDIYRNRFITFKYRADLYILFFEQSLKLLDTKGKLSFICSNRWLNNQYGELLRNEISSNYHLQKILNIENSSPFDEKVSAYPCISTIYNTSNKGTTLYCESTSKEINFESLNFCEVPSPTNASWQNLFLSYDLNNPALIGILDQDFEIGIGVATGADNIFIKHEMELKDIEKSRLLPILTSKDLSNNEIKWKHKFIINPFENGSLCDLNNYPSLNKYLNNKKEALSKRYVARKSPEMWFKTIDKIKPELLKEPKLLLPDIAGINRLLIDEGNFYLHHSLYFITGKNVSLLKILACILMSDFIRDQLSKIGIRMNGGLPRFQAQLLKKLRIPNIKLFTSTEQFLLIDAYDNMNYKTMNMIIDKYCTHHQV